MNTKEFIIRWNNRFPYDKWWRTKYNIAFNSKKHREHNQLDMYLEYLEDYLYKDSIDTKEKEKQKEEELKKGIWIKEKESNENEVDLFENLDLSQINKNSQVEIKE